MSYYDDLEKAEKVYHQEGKMPLLLATGKRLADIVKSEYASEENRAKAEVLFAKIRLKAAFIHYMAELDDDTLTALKRAIDAGCRSDHEECSALATSVQDCISLFSAKIDEVTRVYFSLFDEMGEVAIKKQSDASAMRKKVIEIRNAIAQTEIENPFGTEAKMPDIKKHLVNKVDNVVKQMDATLQTFLDSSYGARYDAIVTYHASNELPYIKDGYEYCPSLFEKKDTDRVRVLHTPFYEEAKLLAAAACTMSAHPLAEVKLERGVEYSTAFWSYFRDRLLNEKGVTDLLVSGIKLTKEYDTTLKMLYNIAISKNLYVYIVDSLEDKSPSLYRDYYRFSNEGDPLDEGHINITRVTYHYLTMPALNETLELLHQASKLQESSDEQFLRDNCKFMGFIGLNTIMMSPSRGIACLEEARRISAANRSHAEAYVESVPSRMQFIDEAWGPIDGANFNNRHEQKRDFDYDVLDAFDRRNVEAILQNDSTTFIEKCGQVVHYALLQCNDISAWTQFDRDEKAEGITRATHLLCNLLDLEYRKPTVEFTSPEEDEDMVGAGGYCSNGGRRIVYNKKVFDTYTFDYIRDMICHEIFHSFQHQLVRNGWQRWHLSQLYVPESRVQRWKENFDGKYQELNKSHDAYLVQIVEADARSFASDACLGCGDAWSTIKFH